MSRIHKNCKASIQEKQTFQSTNGLINSTKSFQKKNTEMTDKYLRKMEHR